MPSFDQTPDKPQPFGYKILWFAFKTSDPAAVLEALELEKATPANWESGLAAVYASKQDDAWAFVSPPIGGWVLAVSCLWPYPTVEADDDAGRKFDALFSRLMRRFDDVQFFGSHRVVDFVTWARALNGEPVRIFAYAGGGDGVLANVGKQTLEEAELRLADLTSLAPSDATDEIFRIAGERQAEQDALVASGLSRSEAIRHVRQNRGKSFPDETDVVELAALWSIDPMDLSEQDRPLALGWAARLPENLRQ